MSILNLGIVKYAQLECNRQTSWKFVKSPVTTPLITSPLTAENTWPPYCAPSIIRHVPAAAHTFVAVAVASKKYELGAASGLVSDKFMVQRPEI